MAVELIHIPFWARVLLRDQQCPFCKTQYQESDVSASGNRRKEGKVYYFYEVECSKCKNPAMSLVKSRSCSSYQLAIFIIQMFAEMKEKGEFNGKNIWELFPEMITKDGPSSLISEEEVASVVAMMEDDSDYEDFLKRIGLTQEELDKYAGPQKGNEDEDK